MVVAAFAVILEGSTGPVTHIDYTEFHGPAVAEWIQAGSLWQIVLFEPLKWSGYYPNTGNVVLLAGTLPWHSDLVARWVPLPWFVLTATAVYALALALGAPRTSSVLAATASVSMPAVLFFSFVGAMPDVVLYAGLTAALLFLLQHWRDRRRADLVLAGLGLGLALGTKWYGLPAASAVGVVWVGCRLAARGRRAGIARDAILLASVALAVGGVWLVRNAVVSGNPLQPLGVAIGSFDVLPSPPDPVRDRLGARIVDYLTSAGDLRLMAEDAVRLALRPVGVLAAIALIISSVVGVRRRNRMVLALGTVAALVGLAYVATPYSAQGPPGDPHFAWVNTRYGVPALLIGAACGAWAIGLVRERRWIVEGLVALAVLDAAWASIRGPFLSVRPAVVAVAVAIAICGLGFYVALRRCDPTRRGHAAAAGGGVLAMVLIVAAALLGDRAADGGRYSSLDPSIAWIEQHASEGRRVAMTGQWEPSDWHPVLALFGPRFGNEVRFIAARRRGTLVEHERRQPFIAELEAYRADLLVATPSARRAIGWARSEGFVPVAASDRLQVLERR